MWSWLWLLLSCWLLPSLRLFSGCGHDMEMEELDVGMYQRGRDGHGVGNGLLRKTEAAIGNRDNEIGSENTITRGLHGPRVFAMDVTVPFCLGLSDAAGGVGCAPFFFSRWALSLFVFHARRYPHGDVKDLPHGASWRGDEALLFSFFLLLLLRLVAPWSGC